MNVNLRSATPDDAPALARVHVGAWHEAYHGIVPDSYLDKFTVERRTERFCQFLATDSEKTYVAEVGGQMRGFLTLGGCRDSDVDRSTTGEIWGSTSRRNTGGKESEDIYANKARACLPRVVTSLSRSGFL